VLILVQTLVVVISFFQQRAPANPESDLQQQLATMQQRLHSAIDDRLAKLLTEIDDRIKNLPPPSKIGEEDLKRLEGILKKCVDDGIRSQVPERTGLQNQLKQALESADQLGQAAVSLQKQLLLDKTPQFVGVILYNTGTSSPLLCGEIVSNFAKSCRFRSRPNYNLMVAVKAGTGQLEERITFDEFRNLKIQSDRLKPEAGSNELDDFPSAAVEITKLLQTRAESEGIAAPASLSTVWIVGPKAQAPDPKKVPIDDNVRVHVVLLVESKKPEQYDQDALRVAKWVKFCNDHGGAMRWLPILESDGALQANSEDKLKAALEETCQPSLK
jgi:hypothetical protein